MNASTPSTSERADRVRRARYADSRDINGILAAMRMSEAELIAADIANNVDKPAQHAEHALKLQIKDGRESWL